MGVLFFAPDVEVPSVLWMRRMLRGLQPDVSYLITEKPAAAHWRENISCSVVPRNMADFVQRAMRRVGIVQQRRPSHAALAHVAKQIRDPKTTVVLVHYANFALRYAPALLATDKPAFVHCHGFDVTWDLRREDFPQHRVHPPDYADRVRRLAKRVEFIANSQATRGRLLEIGVPEERIHVKYLGVPVPDKPFMQCTELSQERGTVNVLFLGRLIDAKGPELTVQAFLLACECGLNAKLTIAGDGPLMAECRRLRDASAYADRIELLGAVDEQTAVQLWTNADIFTAHHRTGPRTRQEEAYGVSVVEAMAAALPVVSGRNGSLPELIENEVHGILIEPGNVEAHAEALVRLVGDPELRASLGRAAWQRARERFTIEQELANLRSLLRLPSIEAPAQ